MNGNVPHPQPFDAAPITNREIHPVRRAQLRRQASDQEVVVGSDGALDAAPGCTAYSRTRTPLSLACSRNVSLTVMCRAAFARHRAHSFGERDHLAEPRPALIALEQMLLDGFLFCCSQRGEPVVARIARRSDVSSSCGTSHAGAQSVNGPMANHPDVRLGDAQEAGDIRAGLLVIERHDDDRAFPSFRSWTSGELFVVQARHRR